MLDRRHSITCIMKKTNVSIYKHIDKKHIPLNIHIKAGCNEHYVREGTERFTKKNDPPRSLMDHHLHLCQLSA